MYFEPPVLLYRGDKAEGIPTWEKSYPQPCPQPVRSYGHGCG